MLILLPPSEGKTELRRGRSFDLDALSHPSLTDHRYRVVDELVRLSRDEPEVASQGFAIEGEGITIGRESGDITFPHDGYVSGSHCHVVGDDTGVYIEDLGSSNGTYMRVRSGAVLPYGSLVLIGQKLFQFERA